MLINQTHCVAFSQHLTRLEFQSGRRVAGQELAPHHLLFLTEVVLEGSAVRPDDLHSTQQEGLVRLGQLVIQCVINLFGFDCVHQGGTEHPPHAARLHERNDVVVARVAKLVPHTVAKLVQSLCQSIRKRSRLTTTWWPSPVRGRSLVDLASPLPSAATDVVAADA